MCGGVHQHKSSRGAVFPQQGVKDLRKLPPWTNTLPAVDTPQTHLCAKPVMVAAHRRKPEHFQHIFTGLVAFTTNPVLWCSELMRKQREEGAGPFTKFSAVHKAQWWTVVGQLNDTRVNFWLTRPRSRQKTTINSRQDFLWCCVLITGELYEKPWSEQQWLEGWPISKYNLRVEYKRDLASRGFSKGE